MTRKIKNYLQRSRALLPRPLLRPLPRPRATRAAVRPVVPAHHVLPRLALHLGAAPRFALGVTV